MKEEVFPLWSCEISQLNQKSEVSHVGDLKLLKCYGENSRLEGGESPIFIFGNSDHKYILHKVKDLKIMDNSAEFLITSYRPGEYSGISLLVTNDSAGFRVENLSVNSTSVLTKEIKEPFPSIGPFELAIPKAFVSMALLLVLLFVIFAVYKMYTLAQRSEYKKRLRRKHTPQTAYNDLTKSLRVWKREKLSDDQLKTKFLELDNLWFEYLEKAYFLPKEMSVNQSQRVFKKENKKLNQKLGSQLKSCSLEFKAARKDLDKLSADGVARMYKQVLKTASLFLEFHKEGSL